jgi:hypothetical protein
MSGYGDAKTRSTKAGRYFEHNCMADGCKTWGSFGYNSRYGQLWFCKEHKEQGEAVVVSPSTFRER